MTLAGPGGIGKTRLAIEAARALGQRLPGRFLDGVRFVPLAALKSAQSLPTYVASALGVELQGAAPPRQQLLSYLEARELLLILAGRSVAPGADDQAAADLARAA